MLRFVQEGGLCLRPQFSQRARIWVGVKGCALLKSTFPSGPPPICLQFQNALPEYLSTLPDDCTGIPSLDPSVALGKLCMGIRAGQPSSRACQSKIISKSEGMDMDGRPEKTPKMG